MKNNLMLGIAASVAAMIIYDLIKSDFASLGSAINPADEENAINTWFNSAYTKATGSTQQLGADVYDWLHN